jgi:elongation factor G
VEQEYGYSVFSSVLHAEWLSKKLNIIDCPGADDFIGGVISSLQVTDMAILLLNAQYGVEVGTQNHFKYTEKFKKPAMFLLISWIKKRQIMILRSNNCEKTLEKK